jgi:D-alanyl-D-alanine carboxypeptidase
MGLGHVIENLPNGAKFVSHGGDNRGWHTFFGLFPQQGEGIVVLTNSDRGGIHLWIEIVGSWSRQVVGWTPTFWRFLKQLVAGSLIAACLLCVTFVLYAWRIVIQLRSAKRKWFLTLPVIPVWRKMLRIVFHILLPALFLLFWWVIAHPILREVIPLTVGWVTLGVTLWLFAAFFTGLFSKVRPDNTT